ncbi:MAG: tetratricopeptide repeat protein [Paracoccaceae bacterium]
MPVPFRILASLALSAFLALPATAQDGDAGAFLAARVASAENDYRAAAAWYARALIADTANPSLLEGAVISHINTGEVDLAAELGTRLLALGGRNQSATLAVMAKQGKSADYAALLAGSKAGQSAGTLLDGLVVAWAEVGAGRMSEATEAFDKLAATQGLEPFGLYHKALALAFVGDFEGADELMSGRKAGSFTVTRRGIVAHAQVLSQLENNAEAVAVLDRNFPPGLDPEIDDLRRRLQAGEPLTFDAVRTPTDGLADVFFTLATALNGEAEDGYTLMYARLATYLRADHVDSILLTAGLLESQKQFELATEAYALIPAGSPASWVAEIGRADATFAAGRKEASIEILQALARARPDVLPVQIALGDGQRRVENFAEALKSYDAAVALVAEPTDRHWTLFYSRGICNERTGAWPAAEADFRRALELNPDQPQVLNYLGYSLVDRGEKLPEALGLIERAVALDPDRGYIIDSLAWALFRLGRYDEAVAPMERASVLEPVDPVVTDHLGDVYWMVDRKLEAAFQWRRALSFDPDEKEAIRIRRKLDIGLDAVMAEEAATGKPVIEAQP